MANASKKKGDQFERDLAKYFSDKTGLEVSRAYYTKDANQTKGEGAYDLIGLPELAIEAKRVEALSFPKAMAQADRNAGPKDMPVVINRRSRQDIDESYVCLHLKDFVTLYNAYLVQTGAAPIKRFEVKEEVELW